MSFSFSLPSLPTLPLQVFPPNGLDRSLHTAVLIGLLIGTFFTETLGWTYAGLVVPGYLATVFFAAPITGAFIIVESIVTYLFVALLGRWISKTGVWSTAFGRERFYLFIVGAVFVRLIFEGTAVPRIAERYGLVHSRELYSVGLVLVPLVANAFWNSGLKKAGPRLTVVTVLTALVLGLLLRTTNLSVSRFQVLNESLSLEFLESPKAHLILVLGAYLGARNNVLYGWDYNGILVPALLAVAWYEPTKLLTTTIEALFIYYVTRFLIARKPFSRMLLVGPRRMMFVYVAGFIIKMLIGFAAARWMPGLQMNDYFGFGYLLPSLLAVKFWNKEHVGIVIMPTLQVSFTSFLVGNVVGYGLVALGAGGVPAVAPGLSSATSAALMTGSGVDAKPPPGAAPRPAPQRPTGSAAFSLLLADTAPRPGPISGPDANAAQVEARWVAHRVARETLERGAPTEETRRHAEAVGISVLEEEGSPGRPWIVLGAGLRDADDAPTAPRAAFRVRRPGPAWIVVAAPDAAGSPLSAAAIKIAEQLGAAGVVLLSRHESIRRHDEAFVAAMADHLGEVRALYLEPSGDAEKPTLSVVGSAVGMPVAAFGQVLGDDVALSFRPASPDGGLADAARLRVPGRLSEAVGAALLGAPPPLRWTGRLADELQARMYALTSVDPGAFRGPSIEELRVFEAVVAPGLLVGRGGVPGSLAALADLPAEERDAKDARDAIPLDAWQRAVMSRLGYRAVRIGGEAGPPEAWGIVEPAPGDPTVTGEPLPPRRGHPTVIVFPPAPREPDAAAPGAPAAPRSSASASASASSSAAPASASANAPSPPLATSEEPAGNARRSSPGEGARGQGPPLLVEVPAPRWQIGAFGAGLSIARAVGADALVIAGSLPTADPAGTSDVRRREGLRSYFQRWHELWLGGGRALSIQAIEADRSYGRDVVISFGREMVRLDQIPAFAGPLLETLKDLELRVSLFDGTREQVPFSAAIDAGMSYAKRFAEGRFAIVYLGSAVRELFELRRAYGTPVAAPGEPAAAAVAGQGQRLLARLERLGLETTPVDVAGRAAELSGCPMTPAPPGAGDAGDAGGAGGAGGAGTKIAASPECPTRRVPTDCDLDATLEGFRRYAVERNPYDLKAQVERRRGFCYLEIRRDAGSGQPWAIAARPGDALILPLDGAVITTATQPLPNLTRARRAVSIGTSALRVGTTAAFQGGGPGAPP